MTGKRRPVRTLSRVSFVLLAVLGSCRGSSRPLAAGDEPARDLTGQWRATLQFTSGAFAPIKDLEFMYVFNQGGTLTESSNYDATPPVPPAYGIWRKSGPGEFEAKYEFYVTKPPAAFAEIAKGGGWAPAGRGVFVERITLSEDGRTFSSKIRYDQYDTAGRPAEGGGEAIGKGVKLAF
jgi:hypothetical protein